MQISQEEMAQGFNNKHIVNFHLPQIILLTQQECGGGNSFWWFGWFHSTTWLFPTGPSCGYILVGIIDRQCQFEEQLKVIFRLLSMSSQLEKCFTGRSLLITMQFSYCCSHGHHLQVAEISDGCLNGCLASVVQCTSKYSVTILSGVLNTIAVQVLRLLVLLHQIPKSKDYRVGCLSQQEQLSFWFTSVEVSTASVPWKKCVPVKDSKQQKCSILVFYRQWPRHLITSVQRDVLDSLLGATAKGGKAPDTIGVSCA